MTASTALLLKKVAEKAVKEVVEYVIRDQSVLLGLKSPQWVKFVADGIGMGYYSDDVLTIDSVWGGSSVTLSSKPFSALLGYWNGPDLIPNDWDDGSLEASLWHDLIWGRRVAIAKKWGVSPDCVMAWANGILAAGWKGYSKLYPDAKFVDQKVKVAYSVCQSTRKWYHPAKEIFQKACKIFSVFAVLFFVSGCVPGCESPPDWQMDSSSGIFGDSVEHGSSTNKAVK